MIFAIVLFKQLFKLLTVTAVIAASGCQIFAQSEPSLSLPSPARPAVQSSTMNNYVKFEVFKVGYSPLQEGFQPETKVFVFRNQQAWSKFWQSSSRLDENLQKPPAPEVNFADKMVIALTSGSKPTGGYRVRIDRIEPVPSPQGARWLIHYTETVPAQDCILTQQPTTPTVFVLTQNKNASIEFKGKKATLNCSN